ncbi:FRG domain-containing protein [Desulfobacter hydrogenophilus]|uniref:FRG domain-containing protein n=1 Tax=Desulfobacter hydrogenophilus TaxID=2291 RepID=A0A328FBP3_9BACT|nr:FRG domain-containing protein [Desulfobacter hydrogenophilus]NDY73713.1 FRG domain-containing protein [Desulfobacter hydrogenophilus]QBH11546.1 FRG domain-containing protein [Desulfobacter hydrogenophilus]RAM00533.1 FRG domain-containing protein [Desulfobacter hydrogenophilus]
MPDIIVDSWGMLQEELFKGAWNDAIQRYRPPFVYRGLSDASYRLETSLMRLGGPFWSLEKHLLRNFRKYSRAQGREDPDSFWHLLAVAQHHGLPTRLMDWTYSPYIALHFALANLERFDLDGVIWRINYKQVHDRLPSELKGQLAAEGAQAFTVELLTSIGQESPDCRVGEKTFHQYVETLTQFDALGRSEEFLLFFEPPSIDERIVNQYALFSVMPNPRRVIDDWLNLHADLFQRIIIPGSLKWECRDKLDLCNITERVLFPGLDGLGSWLKRHYSPKI